MGQVRVLGLFVLVVLPIVIIIVVSMLRALVMILRLAVIRTPSICPVAWERWASPYFGDPLDFVMFVFMVLRRVRSNELQTSNAGSENEVNMHLRVWSNWVLYTGNELEREICCCLTSSERSVLHILQRNVDFRQRN
jgi:hypothetical protein